MNWKKALPLVVLALSVLWAVMLYRDLNVTPGERKDKEVPDVTLEDVEVQRDISGDLWTLHAERAQRFGDKNNLELIKVKSVTKDGALWFMDAPRGTVTDDGKVAELWNVKGRAEKFNPPFSWKGKKAQWNQEGNCWLFPEGLSIEGRDFFAEGSLGVVEMSGKVTLEGGAYARWEDQR
ncbi:hypothetical protein Tlie_0585 [Thermovirga lienii DSM 17291]|jgi:hypothetical protein|uniref:LPS export ABC transporter periplasmic protein LptC n=1 Tax=Thermovirga lienii (strain ATCC BAA-1197 / DSM 17291 / Cas60314) TaxID=580340 RepID=G7V8F8_THELD|nr:LPS export ABC transporter periplasmic protein LptC [Thermovirga lienii]AER66320.1 hypothetical protein Tlie_0585 [Thermovirga lienii DSM 17291]KUK42247.1 MAG: Uncharacterized protein XD70_0936 [Thermovirga lienii]HCD72292.1 hypothetical protein [Thermovirga lienii]